METPYQKYRRELREKAFKILGDCCCQCGEKNPIVLSIDHLEPCQKDKILTISNQIEIVKNPEEAFKKYQLLCRNCNWVKAINNNERRKPREKPFAYQDDLEVLEDIVRKIERKIEAIIGLSHKDRITPGYADEKIEEVVMANINILLTKKGKLDVAAMRIFLREHNIKITNWKAYSIKGIIEKLHPEFFSN